MARDIFLSDLREAQLSESETNLAESRTHCRQRAEQIQDQLENISRLSRQMETLRSENIESSRHFQAVIEEKLSIINRLEDDVEKCKESISSKSLEITQANEDKKELNKTISSLGETISQLNYDVETLNKQHCEEINYKECFLIDENINLKNTFFKLI